MPSKNKNILYTVWFESSVFFRYSKNTVVFRNIEVSNTLILKNEGAHKGKPKKFLNEIEEIGQSN